MNTYARTALNLAAATVILTLTLAGCRHAAAPVDDATLNTAVQNKLGSDPALGGESIQISTSNGVVTLSGVVDSDAARTLAANDATQVPGLKILTNNLTVQAPVAAAPMPAEMPMPTTAPASTKKPKPSASTPAPIYQQAPAPIVRNAPPPPPPVPVAPPKPVIHTFTATSGSVIPVRTTEAMDSGTTAVGSVFHGVVSSDVYDASNNVVIPSGTPVTGTVTNVQDATHFKGSSLLSIKLTSISLRGDHVPVAVEEYSLEGKGRGKNTAEKVGGGAAVGAILGGIFGGGKGAVIGAAAGGGVGAGANAVTKDQQVSIPSESIVRFKLTSDLTITR